MHGSSPVRGWVLSALTVSVLTGCSVVAGCSAGGDTGRSDGPVERFCGQAVSRAVLLAGSGPFYLDGSTADVAFSAHAAADGTWVRVSGDCAFGSRMRLPASATVGVAQTLSTSDGADLAVLVAPQRPADTVVTVDHPDGSRTTITVRVEPEVG